jgi:hypothetical protein
VYDVVLLDHPRRIAVLPFMHERIWVGMNGDWLATLDQDGDWCLVNINTERQIDLPSPATCKIRLYSHLSDTYVPPGMYYKN